MQKKFRAPTIAQEPSQNFRASNTSPIVSQISACSRRAQSRRSRRSQQKSLCAGVYRQPPPFLPPVEDAAAQFSRHRCWLPKLPPQPVSHLSRSACKFAVCIAAAAAHQASPPPSAQVVGVLPSVEAAVSSSSSSLQHCPLRSGRGDLPSGAYISLQIE